MALPSSVLLIGGKGKVGRYLTKLFANTNVITFQASRKGDSTTEPKAANIKPVRFDWTDESTWDNVLSSNPGAIYLVAPQVMDMFTPMRAFIEKARANGTKRFVLQSSTALECDGPAMGKVHAYLKQLGDKGEVEWGVLRPSWFQGETTQIHPRKRD